MCNGIIEIKGDGNKYYSYWFLWNIKLVWSLVVLDNKYIIFKGIGILLSF